MAANQNITQITNIQAVYDPTTIIYGVPLATQLDTTFSGQVFATWLFNNSNLTGIPLAPTAAVNTATTQIATTAYVVNQGYLTSTLAASTYLTKANNLSDVANAASARTNLGAAALSGATFTGTVTAPTVVSTGNILGPAAGYSIATVTGAGSGGAIQVFDGTHGSNVSILNGGSNVAQFTSTGMSATGITNSPISGSTGSFTTLSSTGNFTPSQTAGIVGTTTNNNANAGSVGEHVTATGTAVSLTNNVLANITSISLTAGDWEVYGSTAFNPAASTTMGALTLGISSTSATLPANGLFSQIQTTFTPSTNQGMVAPSQRFLLSATTTIFLVGQAGFGVSTMTATGTLRARRVR